MRCWGQGSQTGVPSPLRQQCQAVGASGQAILRNGVWLLYKAQHIDPTSLGHGYLCPQPVLARTSGLKQVNVISAAAAAEACA